MLEDEPAQATQKGRNTTDNGKNDESISLDDYQNDKDHRGEKIA